MTAGTLARRSIANKTFLCSSRTAAHLLWTIAELERLHPGARLVIIQTCYNTTIAASAGTHDKDAVFDVYIEGLSWWESQRFLRRHGWAAWFRHTGAWEDPSAWHIHMVSIPERLPNDPTVSQIERAFELLGIEVGEFVPGQVDDYFAHALGLAGQHRAGLDRSWFPSNISATIYRYREDDLMAFSDWSDADKKAFGEFIQAQVRKTIIPNVNQGNGTTADQHLAETVRDLVDGLEALKKKIGA